MRKKGKKINLSSTRWHLNDVALIANLILQMMNNMGGEDDLPDLDGADDVRPPLQSPL